MRKISLLTLLLALPATGYLLNRAPAEDAKVKPASEFASLAIDLGIAVSNAEASVKFYTEVVGGMEVPGFEVPGDYCKDAGLTTGSSVKVRMVVLGEGATSTKLKLIEFPKDSPKKNDTAVVPSELGYRYLTIGVTDMTPVLKRMEKAGVKAVGKTPMPLPKGFPEGLALLIVRDPDGNLIEFVGPKK